jgi:hypothetical protein
MNLSNYLQTIGSPKIPSNLYGSDYQNLSAFLPESLRLSTALDSINKPMNLDTTNMLGNKVLGIPSNGSFTGLNLDTNNMMGNLSVGATPTTAVTDLKLPSGNGFSDLAFSDKALVGIGAFNSALGAINSYKTNKLAKQQFAFQKDAFNQNFDAQRRQVNSQLEDRQKLRTLTQPQNNMSVSEYMDKFGVK